MGRVPLADLEAQWVRVALPKNGKSPVSFGPSVMALAVPQAPVVYWRPGSFRVHSARD